MTKFELVLLGYPIFVILAGGYGIRMNDWIKERYGDKPKVLLPFGAEGEPILLYNLRNCMEIGRPENIYVATVLQEIEDYVKGVDIRINVIREPQDGKDPRTNIGRGGAMSYSVERRLLPERDIITVNAVDLCPVSSIQEMASCKGSGFLVAKRYYSEMPGSNLPNVVYYRNGVITGIQREKYEISDGTGLHTGISRIGLDDFYRLRNIQKGEETEDTIFMQIMREGRLRVVGPIETWLPLKIPQHVIDCKSVYIEDFRKTGFIKKAPEH
ncbi:MAG: hypothetical protein J4428_05055 [Candidatus Aenigmarchaeota archaeon]|nr:hypothetical protein [Candidatus Aenigmarchaeota archaeon]